MVFGLMPISLHNLIATLAKSRPVAWDKQESLDMMAKRAKYLGAVLIPGFHR